MRRSCAALFAAASLCSSLGLLGSALAHEMQPQVIEGVGPSAYGPASVRVASADYGGGLLQLLVTGREPGYSHTILYNRPSSPRVSQSMAPQAARAPAAASPQQPMASIYRRQVVNYDGLESPGEVVVDTQHKFLYFVLSHGKAIRYGVGVARPGFQWSGVVTITRKAKWPTWTPPAQMRLRMPSLPAAMPGGPDNPLGARALYLGSTMYRIHGTNQPDTIGRHLSSGCIRMMNQDVEDLFRRVKVGTKVVVI
ncbi:MAG TPA: L,D-transpeptidase [Beijerinckiaceae bacterium]|nr:L,D-transpeptidase [Beijerinckiaceae bacterium]